jgi:sugar lactone lactonase YvrE
VPEIVNNGGFLEGPVWYDGSLYLSQLDFTSPINNADMLVYTPGGGFDVFIEGAGTNGLALAAGQRLLGASQVAAGVLSFDLNDPSATPQDVARMYMGATFNSPNDLTVRSDGNVYFTDPNGNCGNCTNQPVQGTYRVPPGGEPELIAGAPTQPNGISLSPDENTLYVGGSSLVAIPLNADGSVGTAAPFGDNVTGTDGMVVDCAGNLYVTLANGASIIVLDSSGTQLPGSFSVSQPTNVAFGGPESKTLYVTSFGDNRGQLRSVELEVPGFPY